MKIISKPDFKNNIVSISERWVSEAVREAKVLMVVAFVT